jgi:hypothetical protein
MSVQSYDLAAYRAAIRRKARDSGADFWESDDTIDEEINNAIIDIVTKTGSLKKKTSDVTIADQDYITAPTDLLTLVELSVDDAPYTIFREREDFRRQSTTCALIWGANIYLKPTPVESALVIDIWHTYLPVEMSSSNPLPVVYQSAVIPYVLWQYFEEFGNSELATRWQNIYEIQLGIRKVKGEQKVRPEYIMSARFAPQAVNDDEDF